MLNGPLKLLRSLVLSVARLLGGEIRDCRTGASLGRGLLLPWRGKILLIGVDETVAPVIVPQARITYWKQEIGFTRHAEPDFPRAEPAISLLKSSPYAGMTPRVMLVILDHRTPDEVSATIRQWIRHGIPEEDILLAYGGSRAGFEGVSAANIFFVSDPRLRTSDHQREAQSYRAIFSEVCERLKSSVFTHILFVEYDHIPLARDPAANYLKALVARDADVLCHKLRRIDSTIHPHWPGSPPASLRRPEILSMMGTGHFWKREAWEAVSGSDSLASWYLEIDLPTSAHELGFRVLGLPEQDRFVVNLTENLSFSADDALAAGAWTLHPVKKTAGPPAQ